jgi:hypothetical protein
MKNYDPLSFPIGEKQEAKITAIAPVLPFSRLSIYWFSFFEPNAPSTAAVLGQIQVARIRSQAY